MPCHAQSLNAPLRIARLAALALAVVACGASAGDAERGKELSAVCATCHGISGAKSVTPDTPMLAGQSGSYLARTLKDYRSGARQNLIMTSFVKDLSNQDIEDLAAWYAEQKPVLHTPKP